MNKTAYDEKLYPSTIRPSTHPLRLGALAKLLGREVVPFEHCRVMEIGGGDGINLIAMAVAAPKAEFFSFDLAETPVAHGREIAAQLQLRNVRLEVMDLCKVPDSVGQFDYVIAHGVYAWVPSPVREALMALVARVLSPNGVAMISYNAMPGGRVRQALRDMLLAAIASISEPEARISAARETLSFYLSRWDKSEPIPHALWDEANRMMQRPDGVIFHDELGEVYEPQYVSHVIAAARQKGLDYLCDTQLSLAADALFATEDFSHALPLSDGDFPRHEQVRDFMEGRSFRQSLFCKAGAPIERRFEASRVASLWVNGTFEHSEELDDGRDAHVFRPPRGGKIATNSEGLVAALERVTAAFPKSICLDEFADDPELLAALTNLYISGVLEFTTAPFPFCASVSDRPTASPLARLAAARGASQVPTLHHTLVELSDANSRNFLGLLDGTRTADRLVQIMASLSGVSLVNARDKLHKGITAFCRMGLLQE